MAVTSKQAKRRQGRSVCLSIYYCSNLKPENLALVTYSYRRKGLVLVASNIGLRYIVMLKEANEGLNEQKAEFELEKIKLKSELQAEHQEAIKQLEERMQRELAPKNTERMDLAVSTIVITYQRVITPVS